MNISKDTVVEIHYELTNPEGEILDSTEGVTPLAYLHGHQNIIPGLENALLGKSIGEKFTVTIAPAEAYGEQDRALLQEIPRSQFGEIDLKPGMRFRAETDQGELSVVIRTIEADTVTIDANHPLAGIALTFAVEVVSIRPASKEELAHGHVHGAHGHHHDHDDDHDFG